MQTKLNIEELKEVREIFLSYRPKQVSAFFKISSSECGYKVLRPFFENEMSYRENFWVAILNNSNEVLGVKRISTGGITSTIVDVRLIFQAALKAHGVCIIIAHNHPSGKLVPSEADNKITQKIKQVGEYLDIKLLDHIILSERGYFSFADEGKL